MKITAVLYVDKVEDSLTFWGERMGFERVAEVPEGDRLAFVILIRDGAELMIQSVESIRNDTPQFAPESGTLGPSALFIEVDDFEDVLNRLSGYPIALRERKTFCGMREIGVREPGGHIVIFAKPVTQ